MTKSRHVQIGLDVGGTKISGIALDPQGVILDHRRIATPRDDYRATCDAITNLIHNLEQLHVRDSSTIGLGIPGSLSPRTGLVRNANSTCLNGQDLKRDIEARLQRPIKIANDADCLASSEATDGAGRDQRVVWGIILGTGCGSGLVVDGRLQSGPNAITGEWGHNPLPWMTETEFTAAPQCWCGRTGCLETWLSGPAVTRDHQAATGKTHSLEDICTAAQAGDPSASATLDRHVTRLARGMAQVINILDPDVIVIGGGLSRMPHLFDALPPAIAPHLFSDHSLIDIRPPRWGDDSGVRGAARLWARPET